MNIAQVCRHEVLHVSPREGVLAAAAGMRAFEEAHAIMRRLGLRRMPVVGPAGELTGLVSVDDLLAQLASSLEQLSQIVALGAAGVTPPASVPARRRPSSAGLERTSSDPRF